MLLALGRTGLWLSAPVFVTGMIGNGISLRPMPFMMFFIAVSIAVWAMMRQAEVAQARAARAKNLQRQHMEDALAERDGWA